MTVQMPEPIPLTMPPGDPAVMGDLARDIATAGRCLAAIGARISGSADGAPGWLGEDASAAAAQVIRIDTLIRAADDAVVRAADRLAQHAERLLETRRRVSALRDEQDEEFAEGWRRWGSLPDLQMQVMIAAPGARAIVDELEARERSRRTRHTALLDDLEDDAAATARALVDACAPVGGRGRPGDTQYAVAYLAAQLPGWGDRELILRGRLLAGRLTDGTPEEKESAARAATAFAGSAPFATALLAALGVAGVASVLRDLGNHQFADDSPVAPTLAAAFGAAAPGVGADDPVARVLSAEYVRPDDDFSLAGRVATGLAMVLWASGSLPAGGVATDTVVRWGRQFLAWEHQQRERIGTRSPARAPEVGDPTGLAISILAGRGEPPRSAELLDDPLAWQAALGRVYDDGGAALGRVVAQAGQEPGERGSRVARLALATAGSGLAGDDPANWTVNRETLAAVAPGVGAAVRDHIDVAVEALRVGVDGTTRGAQADVVAGLGYVTLDRSAAGAIEGALSAWAEVRPGALGDAPSSAAATLGAFVAVREFGQRSSHAMDALEDQAKAGARQFLWDRTFGIPALLPGPVSTLYGLLAGVAGSAWHNDGTWADRPDRGPVFVRADAAALARTALAPRGVADERAVIRQARTAFDLTAAALPIREAPLSPPSDYLMSLTSGGGDLAGERAQRDHGGERPRIPPR